MKNPYDVLGVDKNASERDIKRAYRRLSKKYHPDLNKAPDAEAKFKEVNDAYDILGNPQKKAQYDQYGTTGNQGGFGGGAQGGFGGFSGANAGGFEDIFSQFFGGGARQQANPNAPQPGNDLQYRMQLSFEDAIFGKKTEISYNRQAECKTCHGSGAKPGTTPKTCSHCGGRGVTRVQHQTPLGNMVSEQTCQYCHGTGKIITDKCTTCQGSGHVDERHTVKITIPAGVEEGNQMRLAGQGEAGKNGGPYGDLYVVFTVKPSDKFKRDGINIYYELPINFVQAALGDKIKVPTVHGDVDLTVPAGIQSGTNLRLRGKGVPRLQQSGVGDQIVTVKVQTPKHLNKKQKEAMQQFAEASGMHVDAEDSFFKRLKRKLDDK